MRVHPTLSIREFGEGCGVVASLHRATVDLAS
jgi:hypothetical protein